MSAARSRRPRRRRRWRLLELTVLSAATAHRRRFRQRRLPVADMCIAHVAATQESRPTGSILRRARQRRSIAAAGTAVPTVRNSIVAANVPQWRHIDQAATMRSELVGQTTKLACPTSRNSRRREPTTSIVIGPGPITIHVVGSCHRVALLRRKAALMRHLVALADPTLVWRRGRVVHRRWTNTSYLTRFRRPLTWGTKH